MAVNAAVVERHQKGAWKDELGLTGRRLQSQHEDTPSLPTGGFWLLSLPSVCSSGDDYFKTREVTLNLTACDDKGGCGLQLHLVAGLPAKWTLTSLKVSLSLTFLSCLWRQKSGCCCQGTACFLNTVKYSEQPEGTLDAESTSLNEWVTGTVSVSSCEFPLGLKSSSAPVSKKFN